MKRAFYVLMMVCAGLIVVSCSSKTKSYTDMLNAEKKAISRLFAAEGFEEIKKYPADGVFGENQFVKLDNGVYLNVVDSGNGTRAELGKTRVYSRFSVRYFMSDTFTISNIGENSGGTGPLVFQYGIGVEPQPSPSSFQSELERYFFSEGFQSALEYVGDQAIVKLIVPFKVGSQDLMSAGEPLFYEKVQYKFE
ncbi:DUF4827 family protein [Parabacteroides sp. 52]|uniref:DUF4827 family protein n=1 Tax=unclassified Parabacteroides TaxID=2649774 RepID=UPI0013D1021A|nr:MULTISPECIES: DUF4827 family protein [unclassified Parabacteroides]MDH6534893.1 hypothetical protein [Parabacteroides sp. PM5-20]NDV55728.1 DUF4827 family protein [Parabacteroides sp. 52]